MTHITLGRNGAWASHGIYSGFQAIESPLPKPPAIDGCPHCQAGITGSGEHSIRRVKTVIRQFLSSLIVLVCLVFRLARLVVGMALGLVGVVGSALHALGLRIVHPDDRRLLPGTERRIDK